MRAGGFVFLRVCQKTFPLLFSVDLTLNWMLPLSKLFIIHDCLLTGVEEMLSTADDVCTSDCNAVFIQNVVFCTQPTQACMFLAAVSLCFSPFVYTSFFPFVLCFPCHHLGTNPFPAPETLNWLFIDVSCNWLLITVYIMFWYSNQWCQLRERGLFSASLSFTVADATRGASLYWCHVSHVAFAPWLKGTFNKLCWCHLWKRKDWHLIEKHLGCWGSQ